ncbi:MAG: topoisomerase IV [Oscillospiraceae bacterium]|nr:topoisomerase IV [Oscillospiraceae bacterium]
MARKKKTENSDNKKPVAENVVGLRAEITEQPIVDTLEVNYMPYAMSVIVSRAIPEIDGFKPSHRKLLYTMYKMGLLTGSRTKSANIVGSTMKLNPHGDAAIYDTMVRLSKGYGALLTPFVDSKGNFGKVYSRDMAYAASRYTEAKLSAICSELFRDIDKDTVDFADSYDGGMQEPSLLPTTFPNVLVSANLGIAVGMASNLCGFNLAEVCQATIEYLRDPQADLLSVMPAPDFPTGGEILYDRSEMEEIYRTGRGSFRVRAKWRYDKENNIIEIYEIPYTTTSEAIIDKVAELVKTGKVKEIADMRDETDLGGLKLAIDLKRGQDPDRVMQRLFRLTPLEDAFSCNFNVLIAGMPRVLGVPELLEEWVAWRSESVRRRTHYELTRKQERLHLLQGLGKILLDIDKAIAIIRETESDAEVVPNLMIGFGIDEVQAEFVADIRLRNINKEYILKQIKDTEQLEKDIADLEDILKKRSRVHTIIRQELEKVIKQYGAPRRTTLVYKDELVQEPEEESIPDYPVTVFLSRHGYLKKITAQSLRMSGEQKYKEDDGLLLSFEATNRSELLVFTDRCQVYKTRLSDFEDGRASALGTFLPTKLQMDEGENVITVLDPGEYRDSILFVFENGKAARVGLGAYATKTNRKKLTGAYSDKSPIAAILPFSGETQVVLYSTEGRALILNTAQLAEKATRDSQGVQAMTLKPKYRLQSAEKLEESRISNRARYTARNLPAAGALLKPEDTGETQLSMEGD